MPEALPRTSAPIEVPSGGRITPGAVTKTRPGARDFIARGERRGRPSHVAYPARVTSSRHLLDTLATRRGVPADAGPRPRAAPAALDEGGPAPRRLEPAPHLARQLHAERQLRLLVVDRDLVALDGRGEAALRAQADLLDRHVLGRLIEAPLEVVLPLEGADLGGHQPQDHAHVFGDEPERREVARAGVVELEEEAVVWQLVEDGLGDPGVAALGAPARPEVAAAEMGADDQVPGPPAQRRLDQLGRQSELRVRIVAARSALGPHLLVAKIGQAPG